MSRVALFFSFIFAVAAGVSYFTGWACDPSGGCTNLQMLGGAAGIMFLAYLVSGRLEAQFRKTKPSRPVTRRAERLINPQNRKPVISNNWRATESHRSRAGVTRGLLMLPSPRSSRDAS
jgi:hypothetical protein